MKIMKRLTALILSVVMVLSMGVSALATGETTSTVENTISNIHWRDNNGEKISEDYTVKREQTRYQLWATINGVEQI